MPPDNRPACAGWGPGRRCGHLVHPGYTRCPWCDRVYTRAQIEAALALPENESFRRLFKKEPTDA